MLLQSMLWTCNKCPSYEYFKLSQFDKGYLLDGAVIAYEGVPLLMNYKIECDETWRTKSAVITQEQLGKTNRLTLKPDSANGWLVNEIPQPSLSGIVDVDLEFSPSTNTLPIRRLNLKVGESASVDTLWVRLNDLKAMKSSQRYTRLDENRYCYENPTLNFTATLDVDELGLVVRYGNLWWKMG